MENIPSLENLLDKILQNEDVNQFILRNYPEALTSKVIFQKKCQQVFGFAGPYKEGDEKIGVATSNAKTRLNSQALLASTKIKFLQENPLFCDQLQKNIWENINLEVYAEINTITLGELKSKLLALSEVEIKKIMSALNSDVIASIIKLMTNAELIIIGKKVFNPLAGSNIGAKGYLSARVQPNSPTDLPEDIRWQVFNTWAYGVGDLMLGNNPASSIPSSVLNIEHTLKEIIEVFNLTKILPWSVLAHIDIQANLEIENPNSTALWFQSIAGTDSANEVFDISLNKMINYAMKRNSNYGLYLETGQGADFTNAQDHGVDMATLESRKYGFAKLLQSKMPLTSNGEKPWLPINDVAGFIGPEVFRTKEQLVRVALEDTIMGKLHGLTIGLDICSTFHMSVTPDDISWAIDQIMPANPAFIMALPTKQDPMLSYLSTGIHEHLHIRKKFGYKINEPMMKFFKELEIFDENENPTIHFGDPVWIYVKYMQRKHDVRPFEIIYQEGIELSAEVSSRGILLVSGSGNTIIDIPQKTKNYIEKLYKNAKKNLFSELSQKFIKKIKNSIYISSQSRNRDEYILHPSTGEILSTKFFDDINQIKNQIEESQVNVQIVISDGLNANALEDEGHLLPFLIELQNNLKKEMNISLNSQNIIIKNGRVRTGYQVGQLLFGKELDMNIVSLLHIIGERPGTEHNNFSVYITSDFKHNWIQPGKVDHDMTKVVSGISNSALVPEIAANQVVYLLKQTILNCKIKF